MACPSSMASERKPPELTPSTTFDNISFRISFRGAWSYTHAELSQDSPGLLEGGADAFKDDRLSGAPPAAGSLLASSWRPRERCPVAPARSEAEAAANAHLVVGDVSQDVVEIPTGLTPRAQVLQPLRLITASPVIPIGVPPLVVRSVQHTVGRSASQTVITARPASAGAGHRTAE